MVNCGARTHGPCHGALAPAPRRGGSHRSPLREKRNLQFMVQSLLPPTGTEFRQQLPERSTHAVGFHVSAGDGMISLVPCSSSENKQRTPGGRETHLYLLPQDESAAGCHTFYQGLWETRQSKAYIIYMCVSPRIPCTYTYGDIDKNIHGSLHVIPKY